MATKQLQLKLHATLQLPNFVAWCHVASHLCGSIKTKQLAQQTSHHRSFWTAVPVSKQNANDCLLFTPPTFHWILLETIADEFHLTQFLTRWQSSDALFNPTKKSLPWTQCRTNAITNVVIQPTPKKNVDISSLNFSKHFDILSQTQHSSDQQKEIYNLSAPPTKPIDNWSIWTPTTRMPHLLQSHPFRSLKKSIWMDNNHWNKQEHSDNTSKPFNVLVSSQKRFRQPQHNKENKTLKQANWKMIRTISKTDEKPSAFASDSPHVGQNLSTPSSRLWKPSSTSDGWESLCVTPQIHWPQRNLPRRSILETNCWHVIQRLEPLPCSCRLGRENYNWHRFPCGHF